MSVHIRCECGKTYAVRDALRGKKVKCAQCGKTIPVPLEAQPPSAADSAGRPAAATRPAVTKPAAKPVAPAAPPAPAPPQPRSPPASAAPPTPAPPRPSVDKPVAKKATAAAPPPAKPAAVAQAPQPKAAPEYEEVPAEEEEAAEKEAAEEEQAEEKAAKAIAPRQPRKARDAGPRGSRSLMTAAVVLVVVAGLGLVAWGVMRGRGKSDDGYVPSVGGSGDEGRKRTTDDGGKPSGASPAGSPVGLSTGTLAVPTTDRGSAGELAGGYLSPQSVVADRAGKTIYVAETTAHQIAVFDVAAGKVAKTIAVPERPSGLALSPDEAQLYVTGAAPEGRVHAVSLADGKVSWSLAMGHTPGAPALSPDGKTLYVCNRFNNTIVVVDVAAKKVAATVAVLREPVATALTPDGKLLFVGNLLPVGPSDGEYIATAISIIDTGENKVVATVKLPNGATSLRGMCVSPDGKYAYAVHVLGRYQVPTTQLERGWMNTNAMSVVDTASKTLVNTILLDDVDLGAANPWGVICSADGKYLCVTHAGTHEISIIDRAALHDRLTKVAAGQKVSDVSTSAADVPNDLSFLVGLRRRLPVAGEGPRDVVLIGAQAYVAEYFTGSLGVVDTTPDSCVKPRSVPLGSQPPMTTVRKGEMFFQDARLCFQKWQSCASCHPDARVDGLNWDLLNDGIGNPKNTKSMLLSHKTPPVMSLGVRDTAEVAVRAGIRFIQFAVRPEEDAVAIDEYLKSLQPLPSPYLVNGELSKAAQRGQKIYEQAKCATCHPAPLFSDLKQYELGTAKGMDKGKAVDTPALIEVWRTGPYLHDGRAATMGDVFAKFNAGGKHGDTEKLSPEQLADLVEYVMSQ